jgi:hypothetical protein
MREAAVAQVLAAGPAGHHEDMVQKKAGLRPRAISRTKGGLNSKLHMLSDGLGRPLNFFLSNGQMSDANGALALPDEFAAERAWRASHHRLPVARACKRALIVDFALWSGDRRRGSIQYLAEMEITAAPHVDT